MGELRHTQVNSLGQATQLVRNTAGIPTQRVSTPKYVFLNPNLDKVRVSGRGGILRRLLTN